MGIFTLIEWLKFTIRHSVVTLNNVSAGLVISVTYDYKDINNELMNEFDTDFANAMLELDGSVSYYSAYANMISVKIPSFSGEIVGGLMIS